MKNLLIELTNDTLKKDVDGVRRFCRMKLTMFTAWIFCLSMAGVDFVCNGLRFDVWGTFAGIALGSKVVDSYAKKLKK